MQIPNQASRSARITGYVLSTIATLFMLMDAGMKIVCPHFVIQASSRLGYSDPETLRTIGIVLLVFVALYVIPRTAVLGAILLTGFLGGAVEANVRTGQPAFNLAFPLIVAGVVWLGLWLRDLRLRGVVPIQSSAGDSTRKIETAVAATAH